MTVSVSNVCFAFYLNEQLRELTRSGLLADNFPAKMEVFTSARSGLLLISTKPKAAELLKQLWQYLL